jgi:adenylate cyclase class IV
MTDYEAEIRLRILEESKAFGWLSREGWVPGVVEEVHDSYYVPASVSTLAEHERWLASGSGVPLRKRTVSSGALVRTFLETKRPLVSDLTVNVEVRVEVQEPGVEDLLNALGLHSIASISKTRHHWVANGHINACFDRYINGALILEVERVTTAAAEAFRHADVIRAALAPQPWCELLAGSPVLDIVREQLASREAQT